MISTAAGSAGGAAAGAGGFVIGAAQTAIGLFKLAGQEESTFETLKKLGVQMTSHKGNRAALVSFQNQIGAATHQVSLLISELEATGRLTVTELTRAINDVTELRNQFYDYAIQFGRDGQNGIATIGGPDGATTPGYLNVFLRDLALKKENLISSGGSSGGAFDPGAYISAALSGDSGMVWLLVLLIVAYLVFRK